MRDCGSSKAAALTPGATVENSGDRRQQDIAPVEVSGALVEMRESEKHGGQDERGGASHAAFQQVFKPSAKEKLFGHGHQEKAESKGGEGMRRVGHRCVKVEKADAEP